jgi:NADH:ubiquinone oxidoreductase subunit 6 (subunit J)
MRKIIIVFVALIAVIVLVAFTGMIISFGLDTMNEHSDMNVVAGLVISCAGVGGMVGLLFKTFTITSKLLSNKNTKEII